MITNRSVSGTHRHGSGRAPGEFVMTVAAAARSSEPVRSAHLHPVPVDPGPEALPARGPAVETRLALVPAPVCEPPYDDEGVVVPLPVRPAPMPGSLTLPFPPPVRTPPRPALRLVPEPAVEALPPVRLWARTTATAIAQILTGERPASALRSAVVPEVYDLLRRKAALAARSPRHRALLRAVHVCCPAPGTAEVTTVVHGIPRPRAVAFRLEVRQTRWVCTVLELG